MQLRVDDFWQCGDNIVDPVRNATMKMMMRLSRNLVSEEEPAIESLDANL
jgi:hypothetical protein